MKRIQSKLHKTGTYELNKISLSCFDDKRYVLDDGINTLTYYHKHRQTIYRPYTTDIVNVPHQFSALLFNLLIQGSRLAFSCNLSLLIAFGQ